MHNEKSYFFCKDHKHKENFNLSLREGRPPSEGKGTEEKGGPVKKLASCKGASYIILTNKKKKECGAKPRICTKINFIYLANTTSA